MRFNWHKYKKYSVVLFLTIIATTGCKEEGSYNGPYKEIELYHLTFDNLSESWKRYPIPSSSGKDSCVFTDDGLLKMILRPGYHGCGGCPTLGRLFLELEDESSKIAESLDRFGMELTVNLGGFQHIEYHYDTFNAEGEPVTYMQYIKRRRLFLNFNHFRICLPNTARGQYFNDTNFDLDENKLDAVHYHLVYDQGETHIYLDGIEQDNATIAFDRFDNSNWPFRLQLDMDRHSMFNDDLEALYIDDLRIYTWLGDRAY